MKLYNRKQTTAFTYSLSITYIYMVLKYICCIIPPAYQERETDVGTRFSITQAEVAKSSTFPMWPMLIAWAVRPGGDCGTPALRKDKPD